MFEKRRLAGAGTRRLVGFVLVAAVAAAVGCNGKKEADMPAVSPPVNQEGVQKLNDVQLDTLRAMKKRLGVTRDEYWDDRGGVLGNDEFEVWYPPGRVTVTHGMYVLDYMAKCRAQMGKMFGWMPDKTLTVVCSQTMEAYTEATGRQWWNYSRIDDARITFQPVPILLARGLVDVAIPREYYEWYLRRFTHDHAPDWLIEGFTSHLSNEWTILEDNLTEFPGQPVKMTGRDIDKALEDDNDRKVARIAYYNALRMVDRLVKERGQDKLVEMLKAIAEGKGTAAAAESVYNTSYDQVVADACQWEIEGATNEGE